MSSVIVGVENPDITVVITEAIVEITTSGPPGPPGPPGSGGGVTPPSTDLIPTVVNKWGYIPTILLNRMGVLPTPLPALGLVVERSSAGTLLISDSRAETGPRATPPVTAVNTWGYIPSVMVENGGSPPPITAPAVGLMIERPGVLSGVWGYIPSVVIENGDPIPTPLPTFGLVVDRP